MDKPNYHVELLCDIHINFVVDVADLNASHALNDFQLAI